VSHLTDQIATLEERVQKAESELGEARATLIVNILRGTLGFQDVETFDKLSLPKALLLALERLVKRAEDVEVLERAAYEAGQESADWNEYACGGHGAMLFDQTFDEWKASKEGK
jgi:hypothetical protein